MKNIMLYTNKSKKEKKVNGELDGNLKLKSSKFNLSNIKNLQKRKINRAESNSVSIPCELFSYDKYKHNELKFLLHVYIDITRNRDYTVNLYYADFFDWIKTSKDIRTRTKKIKQINIVLKEMENNNLIKMYDIENMCVRFEILEQFITYSKESFYNSGFVSVYIDEVQKIMNYDTSKYKGVSNGLLLYTYVCLVGEIKSTAHMRNRENPCYYVKGFYCNLCDEIYSNKAVMKDTVQCLQDLGLIYATTPKRYKKENGRMSCGATIFALTYVRDKDKKIEYYGENYIDSVIEYAERR